MQSSNYKPEVWRVEMSRCLKYLCAAFLVYALSACTKVGFEHGVETESGLSTETSLRIEYDWGVLDSLQLYSKPDTMFVVLSRIVNEKHYVYATDTLGSIIKETISGVESDTVKSVVENGSYYIMAFNYEEENVIMEGLDEFIVDNNASLGDVKVYIPILSEDEKMARYPELSADYNSTFDYIVPISPIYYDTRRQLFSSDDSVATIKLEPKPLTQKLVFSFRLALEGDVELDVAYGSISGVTESIEVMSHFIQDSTIYQTIMEFGLSDDPIGQEERGGKVYNIYLMSGEVNTFGIIPPEGPQDRRGPGILNMTIKAKLGEKSHTYHVGYNLYDYIFEENFIEYQPDGSGYKLINKNAPSYFHYDATMYLNEDFVLECAEAKGAEVWICDEDNNLEIEI